MSEEESDTEEQQLRIELMSTQIDKFRQEMRWQPWVALATILASTAAIAGIILAVAHIIH
jgi:hypothetical protein